ncbi:hypothetical protein KO507_11890 [Gilvimarinus agarilyticus]|uniref:hypothetical protein n=1 Tax=Gilvimarinus sp. 2_MG-2023 TaxID=3062666 RepID=UPI001C08D229|nr:hypothetical protein [Gilvimarinus sp. 2_MG-2023]MBU2886465.1 hypothetical protein [Gilvimarinus agarilyticus]MDO6571144.1 hypothetical protein [Gilvimarinus sp. 2_MG-2023]
MITNITRSLLLLLCALPALAQESLPAPGSVIRFTCPLPPNIPEYSQLVNYYREAFTHMGYEFEMIHRPTRRSLAETMSGASHGDCARIVEALKPTELTLVTPIEVTIGHSRMAIWSLSKKNLTVDQLSQPEHSVCYVEGSYSSRHWVEKIKTRYPNHHPKFTQVPDYATALRMLLHKRITHCLGVEMLYNAVIQKSDLGSKIFHNGNLGDLDAKPILSNRYRALLPDFTKSLQEVIDKHGVINPQ